MNQRLVRRNCEFCKTEYEADEAYLGRFFTWRKGYKPPTFFRGEGCERCGGTGYRGRIGIHEFLNITPRLREALLGNGNYETLKEVAVEEGFHDMRYDGFKKALRGLTTLEEVVEATACDE